MTLTQPYDAELNILKRLVKQGEGLSLEFKLKSNHPEKIVREVVAFANASGGKLIIGISDDLEIKGLKYVDEDEYIITKSIEKFIFPAVEYQIQKIRVEGDRDVLVYDIKASETKPHYLNTTGKPEDKRLYVRVGDKAIQASKELREIIKGQSKGKSFKFAFGDKEKKLMQYLDEKGETTVKEFAQLAEINLKNASRTLVLLVLTGVLKIMANEVEDKYVLI